MPLKPFRKASNEVPDLDEHILDVTLSDDDDHMIREMKDHALKKFKSKKHSYSYEEVAVATTAAQAYMQAVQLEQERATLRAKQKIMRAGHSPHQKRR